jgi:hypothetical protein
MRPQLNDAVRSDQQNFVTEPRIFRVLSQNDLLETAQGVSPVPEAQNEPVTGLDKVIDWIYHNASSQEHESAAEKEEHRKKQMV